MVKYGAKAEIEVARSTAELEIMTLALKLAKAYRLVRRRALTATSAFTSTRLPVLAMPADRTHCYLAWPHCSSC